MNFGLILAGLLFFANPCVNIIDVLPDFFGCILIYYGLGKLRDLDDRFYTARIFCARYLPIFAIKAILSVTLTTGNSDMRMPAAFIFGVLEIIFFITLFTNLFGGIEAVATLYGGDRHILGLSELSQYVIIIAVAKPVLSFIPESLVLFVDQNGTNFSQELTLGEKLYRAKPYFTLFCVVAGILLGLWFVSLVAGYFVRLSRDRAFKENLMKVYSEKISSDTKLMTKRAFTKFSVLLVCGFAFMYDLTLEAVNIFPDFIGFILLFCALCSVSEKDDRRGNIAVFLPLLFTTTVSYAFKIYTSMGVNFRMDYNVLMRRAVQIVDDGTSVWIGAVIFIIEAVLTVLFMHRIFRTADKKLADYKQGTRLPATAPTLMVGIFAVLSAACDIAPLLTAKFYAEYLTDTAANAQALVFSEYAYVFHNYVGLALIAFTAVVLVYFTKINKKIHFEI